METEYKSETGPRPYMPGKDFTNSRFLSRLGELDVWTKKYNDGQMYICVVGPAHRKVRPDSQFCHDRFFVTENGLENDEGQDLHIELYEMCLIYQLCQEHGILKERV